MARRVKESKPRGSRAVQEGGPAAASPITDPAPVVGEQLPLFDSRVDRRRKEWRS